MSVSPEYLVQTSDGRIAAYAREDILKISLIEHYNAGEPARAVYKLEPDSLAVTYARTAEYDLYTLPIENLCPRHMREALPRPTASSCVECRNEGQAKAAKGGN